MPPPWISSLNWSHINNHHLDIINMLPDQEFLAAVADSSYWNICLLRDYVIVTPSSQLVMICMFGLKNVIFTRLMS